MDACKRTSRIVFKYKKKIQLNTGISHTSEGEAILFNKGVSTVDQILEKKELRIDLCFTSYATCI